MGYEFYGLFVGTLFKQITHVPEFEKDLKKLAKRFPSLEEDLTPVMTPVVLCAIIQQRKKWGINLKIDTAYREKSYKIH